MRASFVAWSLGLAACAGAPPAASGSSTPSAPPSSAPRQSATSAPAPRAPEASPAPAAPPAPSTLPTTWDAQRQAAHVLQRLAYGPRPGDVTAIASSGVEAWIRRQLRPSTIPDEGVEAKLRELPTLAMTAAELQAKYPRMMNAAATATAPAPAPATPPMPAAALGKPGEIERELAAAKMIRAVESQKQLHEVLVDFWFNHFNVFADKGADRWLVGPYERDAIRPHVFGRFRDLLGAVAHHPAMLFYLDNWLSSSGALNENYGRELLELHTLGVDGGYTQDDVREAARAFTGWSIEKPNFGATPVFRPKRHDGAAKTILGRAFAPRNGAAGERDGEAVLDLVASHPATARFLARKLCAKLVADEPPVACVDAAATAFAGSGGDLTATYEAILWSPSFWSDASFASKTKTPLEVAASAARAVGATVTLDSDLPKWVGRMGEPLYKMAPPTGYKETADAWVSTGALVARIDFGLALASGRIKGVAFDRDALVGTPPDEPAALVDRLAAAVVPTPIATPTRDTIVAQLRASSNLAYQEAPPDQLPRALGLLLGSPEFQKQ